MTTLRKNDGIIGMPLEAPEQIQCYDWDTINIFICKECKTNKDIAAAYLLINGPPPCYLCGGVLEMKATAPHQATDSQR